MSSADQFWGSDLEREFELEMDEEEQEGFSADEFGSDFEVDADEEADDQFESEADFETEADFEADYELGIHESLAERLAGLAARNFETEGELDEALNEAFEATQDHFLGKALRRVGRFAKRAAPVLLKRAGLNIDAIKRLAPTEFLKKGLMTAAKAAMASNPALAALAPALGPALSSLGLSEQEFGEPDSEAWQSFEIMTEAAYEHMVGNLSDRAAQPLAAMQLAANALKHGASKASAKSGKSGRSRHIKVKADSLRPGDKIVLRFV